MRRTPVLMNVPDIDPRDYSVESYSWGEEFAFHLVSYEARYYAWIVCERWDWLEVYEVPDEVTGRQLLVSEQARFLFSASWGERVATVSVGDEATGELLFAADLLDGAEDGIVLAVLEGNSANDDSYTLARFTDLRSAAAAFAARADQAADKIETADISWPHIAAAYLRHRAALVRAGAARAALGDTIRRGRDRIRAERAVSRVAVTAGVSREFLYRVLAGDDWTWKALTPGRKDALPPPAPARPPGEHPPEARWIAWVRLAIETASEQDALAITHDVFQRLGLVVAGEPGTAASGEGFWTVTANLDLSGLGVIEPDTAATRLSFVAGHFDAGVTWTGRAAEREGTYHWPPDFWSRRPGADDVLGHPAVRAAIIRVEASRGV